MENKPFRIGLCMAGAVSAGAYTAGVLDFLMEALADWEKRKGQLDVPSHKVLIPVLGGASAGGMTAILAASTFNNPITPVVVLDSQSNDFEHPENKLYNCWVDMLSEDMFLKMLETSDITSGKVNSLFNSNFIDELTEKMIKADLSKWQPAPIFFESPVKIFATLSNLEGYNYNIDFISSRNKSKYNMTVHNDYACFEIFDDYINQRPGKGWLPLNFKTGEYIKTAKDAAMATGAFPIGLQARTIEREASHINEIGWLKDIFNNNPLISGTKKSLCVDGGMINNEPFEKVRDLLDEITVKNNPVTFEDLVDREGILFEMNSKYSTFENTVLMIDPFPSKERNAFDYTDDLLAVAGKTLSAMTSQMRSKPADYRSAMEIADASQFLISPSRMLLDKNGKLIEELFGEEAIACGSLSGFGGFLSKEFRIHDYHLGRHNCEVFLRDYFSIPESELDKNPIFKNGYAGVNKDLFVTNSDGIRSLPIIPLFTKRPAAFTMKMPIFKSGTTWPKITEREIDQYEDAIRKRIQKMMLNLTELNRLTNALLWIGSKIVLNKMLSKKAINAMKSSLKQWKVLD